MPKKDAPAGVCRLRPTPEDPKCPFKAKAGDVVTLEVKDVAGSVDFLLAQYDGADIPGTPSKQIQFTVKAGTKNLDVVYVFTDTAKGEGELHEVCSANTFLATVHAINPPVRYVICA